MSTSLSITLPEAVESIVTQKAFHSYGMLTANEAALRHQLEVLTVEDLFPKPVTDRQMGMCCLSGLWLLHNFLDESHTISQSLHSEEGSFWHAIMHRWEGDYSNSKYWYRHVGPHPVLESVSTSIGSHWDPFEFVDRCQAEDRRGGLSEPTRAIALAEWKSLFEYCYTHALEQS